jgi:hypothetical protein
MEPAVHVVKMPKPAKTSPKPLSREETMDIAARKTFAEMDAVNRDKSLEFKIMNERDPNPLAPVPSEKNSGSQGVTIPDLNADMTFSRAGAQYGHTTFMRSRRVG